MDEIVVAKHKSGLKFSMAPTLAGQMKIWIDLSGASVVPGCEVKRGRKSLAKWLREAAKKIERAK